MTFNSRAVATVTVVFPESATLLWSLHDDQSISFIILSTLAGDAGPRAGKAHWESSGLEASGGGGPLLLSPTPAKDPLKALEPAPCHGV